MKILKDENLVPVTPVVEYTVHMVYWRSRKSHSDRLMSRLSAIPGLTDESLQIND